ncbi:hypothetical protein LCGC14_0397570 [marine sediment metagenome]|uniref:Uncharacterized protein n=1 Tax=marine sediment metagenome TaxID=412755 RepID=A0A0F9W718_9ZZZZ
MNPSGSSGGGCVVATAGTMATTTHARPTLFYEDFVRDPTPVPFGAVSAVARILPRRCPCQLPEPVEEGERDEDCGGRGWLYPDPPDFRYEFEWGTFCKYMWRAMGILE